MFTSRGVSQRMLCGHFQRVKFGKWQCYKEGGALVNNDCLLFGIDFYAQLKKIITTEEDYQYKILQFETQIFLEQETGITENKRKS